MNRRLYGKEQSLNAPIGEDGDEWQDWIVDKEMDHELKIAQNEEIDQRKDLLQDSIKILNDREKEILYSRRLSDKPITLEDLSKKFKIRITKNFQRRYRQENVNGVLDQETMKISSFLAIKSKKS